MAVSATSSLQSVAGQVSQQLRAQQVERRADQAELEARSLRQQAGLAQREADRAEENARRIKVKSDRAQGDAGAARQQAVTESAATDYQGQLDAFRQQISQGVQLLDANIAGPVVNADGQTTGTVVNVTA